MVMLVQLRDLGVSFGDMPVLRGVELDLAAGEVLALLGRSGQGKSTLLRLLMGEVSADSGIVILDGQKMRALDQAQWHQTRGAVVAPIFQMARDGLSPLRTLGAQIGDALRAAGRPSGTVTEVLAGVGLAPEVAGLRLDQVSGGMAQRVAIARALARGAKVILADEPTSALDHEAATLVMKALRQAAQAGCGVLLVTHDLAIARQADRVAILEGGRIVEEGGPEILIRPAHLATQRLCAAEGQLEAQAAKPRGETLLSFEGLGHSYATGKGIEGACGTLAAGGCLAVLGPSGAGKSTLARLLAKLIPVMQGHIFLQGQDIGAIAPVSFAKTAARSDLQLVFQEARASFDPDVPLGQGMGHKGRQVWAERLGVDLALLARKPAQVSVGQAQRLALLRALLEQPKVLILDEPTAALDGIGRAEVARILLQLKAEGMGLVLITHDVTLARCLADRVAYCREGRLGPWAAASLVDAAAPAA